MITVFAAGSNVSAVEMAFSEDSFHYTLKYK